MASYADLRKRSNPMEDLQKKMKDSEGKSNRNDIDDDTYWTMDHLRGEDGSGTATIRILPAKNGEEDIGPWAHYVEHIFQGRGHWYVNRSRMTLGSGERDPVYEYNGKLFRDKTLTKEELKKLLKPRKKNYVSNIYIVDDPKRPENNGKVKRFKYGPQIFDIIQKAIFPEFGEKPIPVTDPIDGANLQIRVYTKMIGKDSVPSYEKSGFLQPSPLCDIEDFDAIWDQQYSLAEVVAPSKFLPYPELRLRFDLVTDVISEEQYNEQMELLKNGGVERPKETAQSSVRKESVERREAPASESLAAAIDDEIPFGSFKEEEKEDDSAPFSTESTDDGDWFNELIKK